MAFDGVIGTGNVDSFEVERMFGVDGDLVIELGGGFV